MESLEFSQDSDLMLTVRKNWCCILEEILECPICLDVPTGNIHQCIKGHNICDICKVAVKNCPICEASYNGTRNWCLEKICNTLNDVKSILLDPSNSNERCQRVNRTSTSTQTIDTNIIITKQNNVDKTVRKSVRQQKKRVVTRSRSN